MSEPRHKNISNPGSDPRPSEIDVLKTNVAEAFAECNKLREINAELLDALQWLLREAQNYMDEEHNQDVFNNALNAIAKAKSNSP